MLVVMIILILVICLSSCNQENSSTDTTPAISSSPGLNTTKPAKETESVPAQTESVPVQTESSQEKDIHIEVTPPEGWEPVEGSVLPVQYMKNTSSLMVKEEPYASNTLDEVVSESLEIFKNAFDNVTVLGDSESIKVDGYDAKKVTFTCEVSGLSMKYLYVYVIVEGKTYVITFGDISDSFDTLTADYEAILNNIKFNVN